MNGPEHYRAAEADLAAAESWEEGRDPRSHVAHAKVNYYLARAAIHADLAVAAATDPKITAGPDPEPPR